VRSPPYSRKKPKSPSWGDAHTRDDVVDNVVTVSWIGGYDRQCHGLQYMQYNMLYARYDMRRDVVGYRDQKGKRGGISS
jgi:hypothetical protein